MSRRRTCTVTDCPLHGQPPVLGDGPNSPVVMLVGEAPGADEEAFGLPFVGKSGQELTMYLERFTKIHREHCYVTNIVKCRPPKNRDPHADEVLTCTATHLMQELEDMRPSVVAAVGRVSTRWFMGKEVRMDMLHGIPTRCTVAGHGFVLVPVFHPAYGLHSPRQMRDVIEDFTALGAVVRKQLLVRGQEQTPTDYRMEEDTHE